MIADEMAAQEKLAAQLQTASEAFQGTAGRLLREGEMAPRSSSFWPRPGSRASWGRA
jgi:hypothetical protein